MSSEPVVASMVRNMAYSPQYQASRQEAEAAGRVVVQGEPSQVLNLGDSWRAERYEHDDHQAVTTDVLDPHGDCVYRWTTTDDDADFITLIHHPDLNRYLVFRIALYGYGVVNLETGDDHFVVPEEPESFIWTAVHDDSVSNLLAVEGCYWACPWGVILVDFEEPLNDGAWVDVSDLLADDISEVRFKGWDGWGGLVVSVDGDERRLDSQIVARAFAAQARG
jgi:hypothetical protein